MSRREKESSLEDLLEDARDLFDEIFSHPDYKGGRNRRHRRDDDDDRDDRSRGRGRERASRYEGY